MRDQIKAKRAIAASAIVCAMIFTVPCADMLVRNARGQNALPTTAPEGIDAMSLTFGKDALSAIDRIERFASGDETAELPTAFADEVGFPEGARDARVSASGKVVGFLMDGEEGAVMEELSEWLVERGWTEVPLGSVAGATFMKRDGACTWMLVTCTQVDGVTSVVFRGDFR